MSKESDHFDPIKETLNSPEVKAYFSRSIISPLWRDDLEDLELILRPILLLFMIGMLFMSGCVGLSTVLIPSISNP